MTDKKTELPAFMQEALADSFAFGVNDCCTTADRWIQSRHGVSPIKNARIDFSDETSADEAMASRGGLPRAMIAAMRKARILRTLEPEYGDVGIVKMFGRVCAAIKSGDVWVARDKNGLLATARPDRVIATWRIE